MKSFQALFNALSLSAILSCTMTLPAFASGIITIETHGNVQREVVNLANEELDTVPEGVQRVLKEKGWKVIVTDENLNQKFYGGKMYEMYGLSYWNGAGLGGSIMIANEPDAADCTPHEIGHAVDCELGFPSASAAFAEIFRAEIQNYAPTTCSVREHHIGSEREFFAAIFNEYCQNPEHCKAMCPRSAAFIENAIKAFVDKGKGPNTEVKGELS